MNDNTAENKAVSLRFLINGNLSDLLRGPLTGKHSFNHTIHRKASIKDVVESLGIPHPIIGDLIVNSHPVSFDYIVKDDDWVEVMPLKPPVDFLTPSILRPDPLPAVRFIADVNVGKLASLLRMAGFDTAYQNHLHDADLAAIASKEKRILLTKDISLLKRKKVEFGYLVREITPPRQLAEIIHLFGLEGQVKPFSRCMQCNGVLEPIAKEKVLDRLEPLTKKYYNTFHRCPDCNKIYWAGSHKDNMLKYIDFINTSPSR